MAEFEPGKMQIDDQQEMYGSFWSFITKMTILILVILAVMAMFLV
ncbi:MAG: aa3-type cytochrome c oxidase subunit IV [Pseudomonadota bacterium]